MIFKYALLSGGLNNVSMFQSLVLQKMSARDTFVMC